MKPTNNTQHIRRCRVLRSPYFAHWQRCCQHLLSSAVVTVFCGFGRCCHHLAQAPWRRFLLHKVVPTKILLPLPHKHPTTRIIASEHSHYTVNSFGERKGCPHRTDKITWSGRLDWSFESTRPFTNSLKPNTSASNFNNLNVSKITQRENRIKLLSNWTGCIESRIRRESKIGHA